MAKYMVTYTLQSENRNEAIKRFGTDAINAPEGVTQLGQWHSVARGGGYGLVETDDPAKITGWILKWSDIISYEIEPVLTDEEMGAQFQAAGLL